MSPVWVFFGGGFGALCRWSLQLFIVQPWATVLVNLFGSFVLAYLLHPGEGMGMGQEMKVGLTAGFMGSFTTYSTFNFLILEGIQKQDWSGVALNFSVTVFGALLCGYAGWMLAETLKGPVPPVVGG